MNFKIEFKNLPDNEILDGNNIKSHIDIDGNNQDLTDCLSKLLIIKGLKKESNGNIICEILENAVRKYRTAQRESVRTKCINKDQNGNCPLPNIHCNYPACEFPDKLD